MEGRRKLRIFLVFPSNLATDELDSALSEHPKSVRMLPPGIHILQVQHWRASRPADPFFSVDHTPGGGRRKSAGAEAYILYC
jgi:hypothetical protein